MFILLLVLTALFATNSSFGAAAESSCQASADLPALKKFLLENPTFDDTKLLEYPLSALAIGEKYFKDPGYEDIYRENRHSLTVHDLLILASVYHREKLRIALSLGADPNNNTNIPWGYSALGNVVRAKNCLGKKKEWAELLITAGANPNLKDYVGFTPLSGSVSKGDVGITKLLLEAKGDPEIRDDLTKETIAEFYANRCSGTAAQKAEILSLLDPLKYPPRRDSCCIIN